MVGRPLLGLMTSIMQALLLSTAIPLCAGHRFGLSQKRDATREQVDVLAHPVRTSSSRLDSKL
jgi:hypothetical protein